MEESKKDKIVVTLSGEDVKNVHVICDKLKCTPAEAVAKALKDAAHALTCPKPHQQYEPRH